MSDTRLIDFADTLLQALVTDLDAAGITVPERQYVHSGDFVADLTEENCADALIVAFNGILQGEGATTTFMPGTPIKCAVPLVAGYTIALVRCVPALTEDGDAPTAAALWASAESLLQDAMELANVVINLYLDQGPCNLKGLGAVTPIGPQGAAGGNTLQVWTELS